MKRAGAGCQAFSLNVLGMFLFFLFMFSGWLQTKLFCSHAGLESDGFLFVRYGSLFFWGGVGDWFWPQSDRVLQNERSMAFN